MVKLWGYYWGGGDLAAYTFMVKEGCAMCYKSYVNGVSLK